uniref:uncharacterized protein LOC118155272 n=1 Tax=Callithrix jacchus TaxID=9483 RepID=UPI00159D0228|nr:uncharacterized protein LOC118155272 [Callithrix jacchus]
MLGAPGLGDAPGGDRATSTCAGPLAGSPRSMPTAVPGPDCQASRGSWINVRGRGSAGSPRRVRRPPGASSGSGRDPGLRGSQGLQARPVSESSSGLRPGAIGSGSRLRKSGLLAPGPHHWWLSNPTSVLGYRRKRAPVPFSSRSPQLFFIRT